MSQRTAHSVSGVMMQEGDENSPVEADALGGNVGITNPYINPRPPGGTRRAASAVWAARLTLTTRCRD